MKVDHKAPKRCQPHLASGLKKLKATVTKTTELTASRSLKVVGGHVVVMPTRVVQRR